MEISLSESLQQELHAKAVENHFDTVEDYVRVLLSRAAQSEPSGAKNELERFHARLQSLGLLRFAGASSALRADDPFEPVIMSGLPLSDSILAERR